MRKIIYSAVFAITGLNLVQVIPIIAGVSTYQISNKLTEGNEARWTGEREDGEIITKQDIDNIVEKHKVWLKTKGSRGKKFELPNVELSKVDLRELDLTKARIVNCSCNDAIFTKSNLSGAILRRGRFNKANLKFANLRGASLEGSNFTKSILSLTDLSNANLQEAKLIEANLESSNLREAKLQHANFAEAILIYADLRGASLYRTNLSGAELSYANLSGANLSETNLKGVNLDNADLREAIFNPQFLPSINSMASAKNLSHLKYSKVPDKLIELRNAFKNAGLRRQEREITFAIKHTQRLELGGRNSSIWNKLESIFYLTFFEWTCDYGMSSGRPLIILITLIPIFSLIYLFALKTKREKTGIWLIFLKERVLHTTKTDRPFKLTSKFPPRKWPTDWRPGLLPLILDWRRDLILIKRSYRMIRIALYFSLLSATTIGWREFNIGNWMSRLQRREYILKATGWVRFVSGVQSLISVYMLALWVLTYFGRPFESV